jgi:uncharacterized protein YfaS (alpha-2-macroglobulin family)
MQHSFPGKRRRCATATGIAATALASLFLVFCLDCCSPRRVAARDPDPSRIEAFTAGLVPRASSVRVVLVDARGEPGAALAVNPFSFTPPVSGKASWEDERTVVFVPDKPLSAGRLYTARFDSGLLGASPSEPRRPSQDYFTFSFRTVDQRVDLSLDPLRADSSGSLELSGVLRLTDEAQAASVERALSVSGGASGASHLDVAWTHDSGLSHRFVVKGIRPDKKASELGVAWKASAVGGSGSGRKLVRIPAAGAFELLASRAISGGVELSFSQPLDRQQDLRGLVSADGVEDLRYTVDGGSLKLFAPVWPASARVRVDPSVRAASGSKLATPVSATVSFAWEKPAVRFLSKAAILPTTQGLTLPVETMNVSGVLVEAVRIYGDNMLQFLQVNDLNSSDELKRVGEVVWRKKLDLGWKDDWKNRWVRQGLDLTPLLAANKDGMFQIRITFQKSDIHYICPEGHDFSNLRFPEGEVADRDEFNTWEYVQTWPNKWDDYYKYKDDPCHPAYYMPSWDHDISARRNVLVSDIGVIARKESGGSWLVAASDLKSTAPIAGADVRLYTFQRILAASGTTGKDGMLRLSPLKEPAFMVVSSGGQKSYLKVDSGSSLAVSQFDVGGEKTDDGLKGFLYGERGVWRPGDPIHLTFILYDRNKAVPSGHPISFELQDPLGRVVRSQVLTDSVNGFYSIETDTNQDAETGPYLARVTVGGRTFTKSLRIATVMPNRLKIKLGWGGSPYISTDTPSMTLESSWLTGANSGALKADVSMTFSPSTTAFPGYRGYRFDDPTRSAPAGRTVLFDANLGADGKATFPVELSSDGQPPGALKANILTRVFEPSGVFSSDSVQADFHPYAQYVGVRVPEGDGYMGALATDKQHKVNLALVDRDGKPVKSGRVDVTLYKLEWRWWWEKGEESLAEVAQDLYAHPIKHETVAVKNGAASWTFSIPYPNWGRYLVRAADASGGADAAKVSHASGSIFYLDWPYYSGGGRGDDAAATMLSLKADKDKYSVGDSASITFPSNEGGRALIAVERAGTVLSQEWVATGKDRTTWTLPLTEAMAPNVYVHVAFLQPHLQTANDLPIRLYGVIPIMVEDPTTRLSPVLDLPAEIAPGSDVSFSVREASGRPMTCTVAVVDEGLLGITRYAVPNPWDEFYKKEASSLQSFDLYQYVAGAYSGKLETLLAIGGSDEALAGGQRKANRFPPVVRFFPAFEVKAGATVTKSFSMGPYVGAVRFMVVAGNVAQSRGSASGAAFGASETSVPVRAKLMAQLTAPRILSVGEEVSIPATVFSFMGKSTARVSLAVSGPASIVGPSEQSIDFAEDGDKQANFRIKAQDRPGAIHLSLMAVAGQGGGQKDVKAGQEVDLELRALGAAVSKVETFTVGGGKSVSKNVIYPGAPGSNSLSVELSRLPALGLGDRLPWLIGYPHGCAEQTTSKAFPQLYLPDAVSLSSDSLEEVRSNVKAAISKLGGFQTPRGGFSLWPGESEDGEWLSVYVTHFLVAAQRAGYEVDPAMLDKALAYEANAARLWGGTADWTKSVEAYRLYVLALAGKSELSAMNRLREYRPLPAAGQYRLAAAYALAGQSEAAQKLLGDAPQAVDVYDGLGDYTYGTPFRERASILEALGALGDTERGLPIYKQLADELNSGRWLSTQELGAALSAALPYAAMAAKGEAPDLKVSGPAGSPIAVKLLKAQAKLDLAPGESTGGSYTISNAGSAPVFVTIASRGTPALPDEKSVANGISVDVRYFDMSDHEVDPASVPLGQDLVIRTTVRNLTGADLGNLALTQPIPSGWEIADYRPGEALPTPDKKSGDGDDEEASQQLVKPAPPLYDYQDIRDDRVLTYFSLESRAEKVFTVYANKTYDGLFYLPAVSVEAMYDSRFQAVEPGHWLGAAPRQAPTALKGGAQQGSTSR